MRWWQAYHNHASRLGQHSPIPCASLHEATHACKHHICSLICCRWDTAWKLVVSSLQQGLDRTAGSTIEHPVGTAAPCAVCASVQGPLGRTAAAACPAFHQLGHAVPRYCRWSSGQQYYTTTSCCRCSAAMLCCLVAMLCNIACMCFMLSGSTLPLSIIKASDVLVMITKPHGSCCMLHMYQLHTECTVNSWGTWQSTQGIQVVTSFDIICRAVHYDKLPAEQVLWYSLLEMTAN